MKPCATPGCAGLAGDHHTKCAECLLNSPLAVANEKRKAAIAAWRKRKRTRG